MGNSSDPITLHKYLYANGNPLMYVDPTGHFSMASIGTSLSIMNTLSNVALGTWDLYETVSSGDDISTMDMAISAITMAGGAGLARLGRFFFKGKKARMYALGASEAELKMANMVKTIPSYRLKRKAKPWRIVVISGAFDIKRGRGTSATNGQSTYNASLARHASKFGVTYGARDTLFGTKNTVGRCAEWRAARNLIRSGSKVKSIRWIQAHYVNNAGNGFSELGDVIPPCGICQNTGLCP